MFISLIIGLILGGAIVVFALQNMTPVSVVFLSWQMEGSLAMILILTMVAGILFTLLMSLPYLVMNNFHISGLKNQNRVTKKELEDKKLEVETEKSKLDANNAYLDDLEKTNRVE